MGRLRDALQKRKQKAKTGIGIGVGNSIYGKELIYLSDFILYQAKDELYVAKSRTGNQGFMTINEAIDAILEIYFNGDQTETLTPSAMMNVPIKEELREAMENVLIKHKLNKDSKLWRRNF